MQYYPGATGQYTGIPNPSFILSWRNKIVVENVCVVMSVALPSTRLPDFTLQIGQLVQLPLPVLEQQPDCQLAPSYTVTLYAIDESDGKFTLLGKLPPDLGLLTRNQIVLKTLSNTYLGRSFSLFLTGTIDQLGRQSLSQTLELVRFKVDRASYTVRNTAPSIAQFLATF
jgi:hypothetical protein